MANRFVAILFASEVGGIHATDSTCTVGGLLLIPDACCISRYHLFEADTTFDQRTPQCLSEATEARFGNLKGDVALNLEKNYEWLISQCTPYQLIFLLILAGLCL